jgi:hypothetical protein
MQCVVSSEGIWISVEENDKRQAGPQREARFKMYANNLPKSPKKYREDGSAVVSGMIRTLKLQSYWT